MKPGKLFILFFYLLFTVNSYAATGYKVGNTAPEFNLKGLDGNSYTLASLREKGHVLLLFWATECVYCYAHLPDYKKAHQEFSDKGLTVAAVNIGGEYDPEVQEYVTDNNIEYLVLSDRMNNLYMSEEYHVVGTPTLVLVSPEGKIVFRGHNVPDLNKWIKPKPLKPAS